MTRLAARASEQEAAIEERGVIIAVGVADQCVCAAHAAFLIAVFSSRGEVLLGRVDDGGIDNLPATGDIALRIAVLIEALK